MSRGREKEDYTLTADSYEPTNDPDVEKHVRDIYQETAYTLAADRQTNSLPIVFAELFFIGGWAIAIVRAASSKPNRQNWVNVEAHSIAFSALYIWVISAVILGALIGASQTEASIPRLLQRFEFDMQGVRGKPARRPSAVEREDPNWCPREERRAIQGGCYSWRPTKWRNPPTKHRIGRWTLAFYALIAVVIIGSGLIVCAVLSYLVPPRGPSCRHIAECTMYVHIQSRR